MTEQTVSVTILPGPFIVSYAYPALTITDARGGVHGWRVDYEGFSVKRGATFASSAQGVTVDEGMITKDDTLGPHGSTGGGYIFEILDPSEWKKIEVSAPDLVTQSISFRGDAGQITAHVIE